MKYTILFGGQAGQGPNVLTHVLAESLVRSGYYVFYYRDYQSLIRGGHSFNVLTFSDEPVNSNESKLDMVVALDSKTLEIHKGELKKDSIVIEERATNMYFAGRIYSALGLSFKLLDSELKKLSNYNNNFSDAKRGYAEQKEKLKIVKSKGKKMEISSGSISLALGAIKSGLDVYFGYPMTPSTAVLSELASRQKDNGHLVMELENEISVANAGAGSALTGALTMVGTSGGGFALMSEALSMCGIAKIPLIFYLAQRAGPATGVPTYSSQGDLKMALYSGSGEFPRIVMAPGDIDESVELINQMFYLTQKFGCPGIFLSDKHLAESFYSRGKFPLIKKVKKITEFGRYNSYESDPFTGSATEDASIIEGNILERKKRTLELSREAEKFSGYKIYGKKNSKNVILFWGSTKGAILDAIKGLDVCAIQILYLEPFPLGVEKILKNKKKIIGIETNVTGQLASLVREKTGIKVDGLILRHDGRPFLSDKLRLEIVKKFRLGVKK